MYLDTFEGVCKQRYADRHIPSQLTYKPPSSRHLHHTCVPLLLCTCRHFNRNKVNISFFLDFAVACNTKIPLFHTTNTNSLVGWLVGWLVGGLSSTNKAMYMFFYHVLLIPSVELEAAQTKRQSHLGHLEVVCKLVLCQIPSSHEEKGQQYQI